MKRVFVLAIAAMMIASCKKAETTPSTVVQQEGPYPPPKTAPVAEPERKGPFAEMTFDKTVHDFGKVNQGDKVTYSFNFENTGEVDLVITEAKGTCGCTVPDYPKDPIKPGQRGKIKVEYNSAGKKGNQTKSVNITANTKKGREKLQIKATVIPKDGPRNVK